MSFEFHITETVKPSRTSSPHQVRVYEWQPKKGRFPQNWIHLTLDLKDQIPLTHTVLTLVVTTTLESRKPSAPIEFRVRLEPDKKGCIRLLLKMLGNVQAMSLCVEPADSLSVKTLSSLKVREFSRPYAMGWLVSRETGVLLTHPVQAARLGRDSCRYYKQGGVRGLLSFLRKHFMNSSVRIKDSYDLWVENFGVLGEEDRRKIRKHCAKLKHKPKISIVMPVYNTDERWLRKAIESVINQIYPHWELCIADDKSSAPHIKRVIEEYASKDDRIRVVWRKQNGHISRASNSALTLATGKYTALLDHDDELSEDALYWVAKEVNDFPSTDLIYSDEDKIDSNGRRFHPHFKMEWNVDLLYSLNLVTHLAVFRTKLLKEVRGFRTGFEGSQDYDLVLRVAEKTTPKKIRHIPRVLYHWRAIPGSTAIGPESKVYAHDAAKRSIEGHFRRTKIKADVLQGFGSYHRVRYHLPKKLPLVSILICTRDKVSLLKGIVTGILEKTDYPNIELVIVDNESKEKETLKYFRELSSEPRVRIVSYPHPFNFAAMNNFAVMQSRGELVAFINNDLEVIRPDWLKEMVSFAIRPEFGAVGARLLYPDGRVQHAGVVLGVGGVAGHAHKYSPGNEGGYMSRSLLIQSFSAVTAACLVMRRNVFDEIGGFDAKNLAVAFNDVDLCLKIRSRGYRVVYTPYAELYHLESASRGSDLKGSARDRLNREDQFMRTKWGSLLENDPFYNPNLTLTWEDYGLAFPPRLILKGEHGFQKTR
jgi:O-antigen biosynthesis protein